MLWILMFLVLICVAHVRPLHALLASLLTCLAMSGADLFSQELAAACVVLVFAYRARLF